MVEILSQEVVTRRTDADHFESVSSPQSFFEAPPSHQVPREMERFVEWFNSDDRESLGLGKVALQALGVD